MKLLFLRGQVPTDRDPRQIMFNDLDKCDDMWTQLAYAMCKDDYGEVWYWGGKRKVKYKENFIERWIPKFQGVAAKFTPDIVFARGGFPQYDTILKRYPGVKVYYGAGKRFFPNSKFRNFDLILNDTQKQASKSSKMFPQSKVRLFVKPAADNVFRPIDSEKRYDVIFVGNEHSKGIKGHEFILKTIPSSLKVLQVGIVSKSMKQRFPHVTFTGWKPRRKLPYFYAQSKVAVVSCEGPDSCPRVIPEALACDCPVVVTSKTKFWHEKYITESTGALCHRDNLLSTIQHVLHHRDRYCPRKHYDSQLSLHVAAQHILNLIGEK